MAWHGVTGHSNSEARRFVRACGTKGQATKGAPKHTPAGTCRGDCYTEGKGGLTQLAKLLGNTVSGPSSIPDVEKRGNTVDGRNFAPPKKPWNDDSPVNTNKQWLPMVSKWCRISSIHSTTRCHEFSLQAGVLRIPGSFPGVLSHFCASVCNNGVFRLASALPWQVQPAFFVPIPCHTVQSSLHSYGILPDSSSSLSHLAFFFGN